MRIIIVGGGKAGSSLVRRLLAEDHEVTVVDTNEQVIKQLNNSLDIIGCIGNGCTYPTLKSAGAEQCDLLIAVTSTDEMNLLCCLVAHTIGAKRTIARVRNPEYLGQLSAIRDQLGLNMVLNPEKAVADAIARILRFPSASHVELFARGRVEVVSIQVSPGNVLDNLQLSDLPHELGAKVLICAVNRNSKITIPGGSFVLKPGDQIYFTGSPAEIEKTFRKAGLYVNRTRNVLIAGGGRISHYLAQQLCAENMNVRILERDRARAQELAGLLPTATVLCGDMTDYDLLEEEGLERQDAFIALTGIDESNILSAMYAQKKNVRKVIAKVNNDSLYEMIHLHELQTLITPKQVTGDLIMAYVRSIVARHPQSRVLALYNIAEGLAEMLEFRAMDDDRAVLDIPLSALRLKPNLLVACIVRTGEVIIPNGSDVILEGDRVLIVTAHQHLHELTDILEDVR